MEAGGDTATRAVPARSGCQVISVVVPVRDAMPWLPEQLDALASQVCGTAWEVVVADNGSTDDSAAVAAARVSTSDRFHWVDASARPGPAAARNLGVASARGELLAFCDADDVVRPGWLAALVDALADADVVAGAYDFGSLNGRGPTAPRPAATGQLGFLPAGLGANLAVRRAVFDEAGGFAEELRVGEDVDLCWRLQLEGCRFALAPDAVVAKRDHPDAGTVFRHGVTYGRSGPELYRRYRGRGARRDLLGAAKSWLWLVVHLGQLARPGPARNEWVHAAGVRVGRVLGSAHQRVVFP